MLQLGLVALAIGIIGFIWGVFQKVKAGRVAAAPLVKTGDAATRGATVAGPKGAISAQGTVSCPQPIVSPVTGTTCLFYELTCSATWKHGDSTKTKEFHKEKVAANFTIDDGSGPVWVDAKQGGTFEPMKTHTETKGAGLLGSILGGEIAFGSYRFQTGMFAADAKFTVLERVLPLQTHIYACGKAADAGGAIGTPGWRSLILSNKTRDEVLAHATKSAKMFLLGGPATTALGVLLAVLAPKSAPAADAAPLTATSAALSAATVDSAAPSESATPDGATSAAAAKPGMKPAALAKPSAAPKPVASAKTAAPAKPAAPVKPNK